MSVKSKVKKLNKEILNLKDQLETINLSNSRLKEKLDIQKQDKQYVKQLENIIKFAVTNQIGGLKGGMQIERYGIDKMQNLRLMIDYETQFNTYIIRVSY